MDIRLKSQNNEGNQLVSGSDNYNNEHPFSSPNNNNQQQASLTSTDQQLNDAMIFNIMKKIQLRQKLVSEYAIQKEQFNKNYITKYLLHGNTPVYYALAVFVAKCFRYSQTKNPAIQTIISLPNLLFHLCVIISLNQYNKYNNIFNPKSQSAQEYKIYQHNVESLVQEKMKKFSILNKLKKTQFMNQQKITNIFKYRLIV